MKKVVPFTKTITFRTMIAEITDIEVKHTLELGENHEIEGDILVDGTYKMTDASQIEEEFHYKLPFTIAVDSKYDLENLEITIGDFYFEIINEEDLKINIEIEMDGMEEKKEEFSDTIATKIFLDESTEVLDMEETIKQEELVREASDEEAIPVPLAEENQEVELQTTATNPLAKLAKEIEEDIKNEIDSKSTSGTSFENAIVESEKTSTPPTNVSSIFSSLTSNEETFSTYYVYMVREEDSLESIIEKYHTTREELQNYNDLTDVKVGCKLIIPCAINE